jgi:hypothetical protein
MSQQPRPRRLIACLAALAFGIAVLAPAVALLQLAAQETKAAAPLRMVPPDAVELLHIRVAELAQSKLLQVLPDRGRQLMLSVTFELPDEQVESVTMVSFRPTFAGDLGVLPHQRATKMYAPKDTPALRDKDFPSEKGIPPKDFQKEIPQEFVKDLVKDAFFKDKLAPPEPPKKGKPPAAGESPAPVFILALRENLNALKLRKVHPGEFVQIEGKPILRSGYLSLHLLNSRTLLVSPGEPDAILRLLAKPGPVANGPLAPVVALAASGNHTLTYGLAVPEKVLQEAEHALLEGKPDGPTRGVARALLPLMRARPTAVTFDLHDEVGAAAELHFADAAAAKKGASAAADALVLMRIFGVSGVEEGLWQGHGPLLEPADVERVAMGKLFASDLEDALRAARVEVKDQTVRVAVALPTGLDKLPERSKVLAKELLKDPSFLAAGRRTVSQNQLKQIGLALHSFHDVHKRLPAPAICDPQGKPLLSWRVAILPFIEQQPLFEQFKLDEPWNSAHNRELLEKMPKIYAAPGVTTKEPYTTFYQAFVGPGAGFERVSGTGVFNAGGVTLAAIRDGTANTIAIAEAAEPVPWTKPADLAYDPKGPLPRLGGVTPPGFNAVFMDGQVRYFDRPLDEKTLRAWITRAGGEEIYPPGIIPPE